MCGSTFSPTDDSQPYIFTAIVVVGNLFWSDRRSSRSLHIIIPTCFAIVGIIITVATTNVAARYFALFLMLPGTYGCFQVSNAWMANIGARPNKKRGISLAMNNAVGNLSLVWTPYLYPDSDGPRYTMAWSVNLALSVVLVASTIVLHFYLKRDNKKIDELDADSFSLEQGVDKRGEIVTQVEQHGEHITTGRRLGGRSAGLTTRYQT